MRSRGSRRTSLLVVAVLVAIFPSGAVAVHAQDDASGTTENPYFGVGATPGSGVGRTIGYIALGDAGRFTDLVRKGIEEQAAIAGADLLFCDSQFDADRALQCGRLMAEAGADGILNFQVSEAESGRICAAYGNLPTIAIDIHQAPCERSFVGADNRLAGLIAGAALGEHMQDEARCIVDTVVIINAPNTGAVGVERTQGMLDGFESVCGSIQPAALEQLEVTDEAQALDGVARILEAKPVGGLHAIMSINENLGSGGVDAADQLGRGDEVRVVSQDFANVVYEMTCDPRWVAAVAYFPELYGHTLIPAMIDLLDGKEVPLDLFTVHEVVTAENIGDFVDEVPDCAAPAS